MQQAQHRIKRIFSSKGCFYEASRGRCAPDATENPAEGRRYKPLRFSGARVCTDVQRSRSACLNKCERDGGRAEVHTAHVPRHSRACRKMARALLQVRVRGEEAIADRSSSSSKLPAGSQRDISRSISHLEIADWRLIPF